MHHPSDHWCRLSMKLRSSTFGGFTIIVHARWLHYLHPILLYNHQLYPLCCLLGLHHLHSPDNAPTITNNFDPVDLCRSYSHRDCLCSYPVTRSTSQISGFLGALFAHNYFRGEPLQKAVHRVLGPSFRRYLAWTIQMPNDFVPLHLPHLPSNSNSKLGVAFLRRPYHCKMVWWGFHCRFGTQMNTHCCQRSRHLLGPMHRIYFAQEGQWIF